ncbi:MAG TPA: flagellar filament capping protein FliD [Solirubrobacteraceae bacterium]|jgi:flagellar hook-associated protein 2|nr:flagellar filament capping protein FliD [Solirubrobacteraceae bacterium]
MSTSGLGLNSTSAAPITVTGLASGLETTKIIEALMSSERAPVKHLTNEQFKLGAEESQLQGIQSKLQQLSLVASEFSLPSLFDSSQSVTSSEPQRVSAASSAGAGVGGYEVEVTQLANSAQRTFSFATPPSEQAITIDGQEFTLKEGESAQELASAINANSKASVYAAVLTTGAIVFSDRATGDTGSGFIKVSGAALTEVAGTAKEGKNANFVVDGVEGESASNTITDAIPGVTLTLGGLTPSGPVTIDVQPPGPSSNVVEAQVQSFIKLYNSIVEEVQTQLQTKPFAKSGSKSEYESGILFGDPELTSLLDGMRETMYEPIEGLSSEMSSLFDIGVSTGSATGSGTSSQASLEGLLTLEPGKLSEALKTNPAGVEKMLQQWSQKLQTQVNAAGEPGGGLEARINGDSAQVSQLTIQINTMNELLAHREKALQATYAALEGVISRNTAQSTWLTQQEESLSKSGI